MRGSRVPSLAGMLSMALGTGAVTEGLRGRYGLLGVVLEGQAAFRDWRAGRISAGDGTTQATDILYACILKSITEYPINASAAGSAER